MKRPAGVRLPKFAIDRASHIPYWRQVTGYLRLAISTGELTSGQRLPSSRAFATVLGVSRNTVLVAYETLCAEGWLSAEVGHGTRVRLNARSATFDVAALLRDSHYPAGIIPLQDPDGTPVYLRRN